MSTLWLLQTALVRGQLAPIELIHPGGAPRGTAVLGADIPDWLAPLETRADGDVDIVFVDAAADQPDRLARAASGRLSDTGVVLSTGSTGARRALASSLEGLGFSGGEPVLARRGRWSRGESGITLLVPDVMWDGAWGRVRAAWGTLDARAESVRLSAFRREGVAPLGTWLPGTGALVVRTSWRGSRDAATVARLTGGGSAALYAKLGLGETTVDVGAREATALYGLGAAAEGAGARVPAVQGVISVAGRPVALLSPVEGRPVARARRESIARHGRETLRWLGRFAMATRATAPAPPLVEAAVMHPATEVVRRMDGGTAYLETLRRLADRLGDAGIPVAAAHGDLTLWNVLEGERPGILDWEGAVPVALPLLDLPYLLVDIRHTTARRSERPRAFEQCFPRTMDEHAARAATGLELPAPVVELAFHACWLGHAADERRRGIVGPFNEIVQIIARRAVA